MAAGSGKNGSILICEPMRAVRDKMILVIEGIGCKAIPTEAGKTAYALACQHKPAMIIISTEIRDVHIENIVKVFKVSEHTKGTPLLVATEERSKRKLAEYVKAGADDCILRVVALETMQQLFEKFVGVEEEVAVAPKSVGPSMEKNLIEELEITSPGGKKNPLLIRNAACPLHLRANTFHLFTLRAKSQAMEQNQFDITVYRGGKEEYQSIPYLLYESQVCPECYYASADFKFFLLEGEARKATDIWPTKTLEVLKSGQEKRDAIVRKYDDADLFSEIRSVDTGLLALELAAVTSQTIYDFDGKTYSAELYRVGNYYLRMAQVCKEARRLDDQLVHLQAACDALEKAQPMMTGTAFHRINFQIIALMIALSQDAKAEKYLSTMGNTVSDERRVSQISQAEQDANKNYYNMARQAWENRDSLRLQ